MCGAKIFPVIFIIISQSKFKNDKRETCPLGRNENVEINIQYSENKECSEK